MNERENELIQDFANSEWGTKKGLPKAIAETIGTEEDEICMRINEDGLHCPGIIEAGERGGCSCHINPPCSACTEGILYCEECGWEEENA